FPALRVEDAEVREVGPAGREHRRRQRQAHELARRLDGDVRGAREELAQIRVRGRGGTRDQRDEEGEGGPHVFSTAASRKTKRWYASETRISEIARPRSDATR